MGEKLGEIVYVSYGEAQELIPVFQYLAEIGPWRIAREDARVILRELKAVRDVSYEPMGGRQIFLTGRQRDFFKDVTGLIAQGALGQEIEES